MTTLERTNDGPAVLAGVPVGEVVAAARELSRAGRWRRAVSLLEATAATDASGRARLALAAAEVAVEHDWYAGTAVAADWLDLATQACAGGDLDPGGDWDLAFLRLRYAYFGEVLHGGFRPGPAGKDPAAIAELRRTAERLRTQAPDGCRRGWAEMYLGLIADNVFAEREVALVHYEAALRAGENTESGTAGDSGAASESADLLVREALRHLGDHRHEAGDHQLAFEYWARSTEAGARAGTLPGTLAQLILVALFARDTGDEAGATILAREIARWSGALGAARIEDQARDLLAGSDPTARPDDA
jgi:tetratricopeptide (TPR) repeat protein